MKKFKRLGGREESLKDKKEGRKEEEVWTRGGRGNKRAGQEGKVWAYLTGQALLRSLCRLTEDSQDAQH